MLFVYPDKPHDRRHGPAGYSDYRSYKPWLRDEFFFQCVYCLLRERWVLPLGKDVFSVDHLVPKSLAPLMALHYDNLVYSCVRCNNYKSDQALIDPCVAAYGEHLYVDSEGAIHSETFQGRNLIDILDLNHPKFIEMRKTFLGIHAALRRGECKELRSLFFYPTDTPDLRQLNPPDNFRPDGLETCHFARQEKGELPQSY